MTVIWVQTPAAQVGHSSTNKSESASQQVWYLILLKNKLMQKVHVGWLEGLPHTRKKLEARSEETYQSRNFQLIILKWIQPFSRNCVMRLTSWWHIHCFCCLFRITEQEYCFKNENNEKNLEKNVYIKNSIIFRLMWNRQTANAKAMEAFW